MTVPGDGVETMRPRNCLTSLRTPKEEGPAGLVNIKNWNGTRVPIGAEMVGSRTPEATKERKDHDGSAVSG